MLDLLMSAEKKKNLIDHEGIKDEVSIVLFAGHDTTGMACLFATLMLAEHEDVQVGNGHNVFFFLNSNFSFKFFFFFFYRIEREK